MGIDSSVELSWRDCGKINSVSAASVQAKSTGMAGSSGCRSRRKNLLIDRFPPALAITQPRLHREIARGQHILGPRVNAP